MQNNKYFIPSGDKSNQAFSEIKIASYIWYIVFKNSTATIVPHIPSHLFSFFFTFQRNVLAKHKSLYTKL